jgi:two-component system sensor histidine kinase CpxA
LRPRFQLFGKIFLGFWLATIAILASWQLSIVYFEHNPDRGAVTQRPQGPPQRFVLRMMYDLQNLEEVALEEQLEQASARHDVVIYLLDRQGVDLFGRELTPAVADVAGKLQGSRRRAFLRSGNVHLLAHKVHRADRGLLRAVFVFRPPRHHVLGLLGSSIWMRVGLAVLISGLVCYLLSRLLTRRINNLQLASRRLATGDLGARLRVRDKGGDETDELARDFNSMAEQLQERIEAQKRLLGDVSHELRSPLARLRIALALAQENSEKTPEYLQRIERETERLEELIGQLLDTHGGSIELNTHIDLVALLKQLCNDTNFEGQGKGKKVTMTHSVPRAMVATCGDLLHKSFENIIRNGLHHSGENTEIVVTLEQLEECYTIQVSDSGGGVPEPELDKIFEAFYRTDLARTRTTGGIGLGLAIARRAINQHGGQVAAANSGAGLTVTVSLPRADRQATKSQANLE